MVCCAWPGQGAMMAALPLLDLPPISSLPPRTLPSEADYLCLLNGDTPAPCKLRGSRDKRKAIVKCLSHANKPYIVATKNSAQAMGFQLACNLAFLMHNLHSNNFPSLKKFCKDVWDSLSHLWSSATGKRKEGGCCKGESSCGKLHGRCWNLFFEVLNK